MSSAQTQTRGSEAKHIGLPTHARQQKTAQGNPCASYRVKKQTVLATPIPCQPSKPRVSPAIRGVITNWEVGQRGGVLLQSLHPSFFQCHTIFFFFFFWVGKLFITFVKHTFFFFFFLVGKLFITSVKHTCSERTTRAMFSLCVDQQQANQTTCKTADKTPARRVSLSSKTSSKQGSSKAV